MRKYPKSEQSFARSRKVIAGGVVSLNRAAQPEIVFTRAQGPYLWDADGNQYTDYHAAFAANLLGHNDPSIHDAISQTLNSKASLYGSGTTLLEIRLAELLCEAVPAMESVQIVNTGGEATYHAIRLARAVTGRDHIIVIQGGYNGFHNDVSCNVMTPLSQVGARVSPGEYPFCSISSGIPTCHQSLVHVVNFNDLQSIQYVCQKYPIAALITEPILQNIGVVKPLPGYLEGVRELANRYGFIFILDEIKTGFRYCAGGYSTLLHIVPDLVVFGKAMGSGYPIAVLGGKRELMDWFAHADPSKRVALAGTYNAHPIPTAAAIATLERMASNGGEIFHYLESLGKFLETKLAQLFRDWHINAVLSRQGSAFCIYFMDHCPLDWHDLAEHHDFDFDQRFRTRLVETGSYFFPVSPKQCSISAAHSQKDIENTLQSIGEVLVSMLDQPEHSVR